MTAGSDCHELLSKTTEEDKEEEMTTSLAAANAISVNYQQLNDIFAFKEEQTCVFALLASGFSKSLIKN